MPRLRVLLEASSAVRWLWRQHGAEAVDLIVHSGEAVALLGRNGVGKTTLLRSLSGTLAVSDGNIVFDGTVALAPEALRDQPARRLAGSRRAHGSSLT